MFEKKYSYVEEYKKECHFSEDAKFLKKRCVATEAALSEEINSH